MSGGKSGQAATAQTGAPHGKEIWSSTKAGNETEAGRLTRISQKEVAVEPFAGGGARTFKLGKDVPVFFGQNQQPTTQQLGPGDDVRVFFKAEPGKEPKVIALEVLSPDDARRLQQQSPSSTSPSSREMQERHEQHEQHEMEQEMESPALP